MPLTSRAHPARQIGRRLVFEDIHWGEAALLELIARVAVTSRPSAAKRSGRTRRRAIRRPPPLPSLARSAAADLKSVQEQLWHTSIVL